MYRLPRGFRIYRTLAPTRDMMRLDHDRYREAFFREILGPLDPREEWERLHQLVAPNEPVLLCFEKPPFTVENFCHRRMVAEWFAKHLGVDVPELALGQGDLFDR